jgi:integrase
MLSERQIQSAIKTCTGETVLNDGAGGKGGGSLVLVIRRRADGSSSNWYGQWWEDGKRRRKPLGPYPAVPLAQARTLYAGQVRDVLAVGKNPRAIALVTDKPTVSRLFDAYCDQMKADGKRSEPEHRRCLKLAAQAIGENRLASQVDPSEISAYLGKLFAAGTRSAADHVRSYLSAAFSFGMKSAHDYRQEARKDWGIKFNPVAAVPKDMNASTPGDRALTASEIGALWRASGGETGFGLYSGSAVRLLLCTGQRVEELLRLEAHEIDRDAQVWRMPAEKTKTKKAPHNVPLPALAMPVLEQLLAVHRRGFLFDGMAHQAVNRAISRWLQTVDVPHFTSRDLRRTWKSRAADAGVDRFTRDLIQQHAMGDTGSRHYDRADYGKQMADAMEKWDSWLTRAIESGNG